ncbi:hypothetical protein D3C76_1783300 [compost metagenome]
MQLVHLAHNRVIDFIAVLLVSPVLGIDVPVPQVIALGQHLVPEALSKVRLASVRRTDQCRFRPADFLQHRIVRIHFSQRR